MILVHDIGRKDTFQTIESWNRQVLAIKQMPVIVLGNKCDMPIEK